MNALNYHPSYDDGTIACPWCGSGWTHINWVHIGARDEDRPTVPIVINAITADISLTVPTVGTAGTGPLQGQRRHWIELQVDCEECPGGTLTLAQHKGATRLLKSSAPDYDGLFVNLDGAGAPADYPPAARPRTRRCQTPACTGSTTDEHTECNACAAADVF